MKHLSDEVLIKAYEKAKKESLNEDFILLLEDELKYRNLLNQ